MVSWPVVVWQTCGRPRSIAGAWSPGGASRACCSSAVATMGRGGGQEGAVWCWKMTAPCVLCIVDSVGACMWHLPLVAFLVSFGLVQELYTAPPAYMLAGALLSSTIIGQLLMQQHSCVACAVNMCVPPSVHYRPSWLATLIVTCSSNCLI